METDVIEGTVVKDKGIVPAPEAEKAESTSPEAEPTVRTFATEAEFQKAVSKGLEAHTKQLSIRDAETKAAKVEAEAAKALFQVEKDARVAAEAERDGAIEARFADDPEALKGYKDKRAIERERRQLALEKAEVDSKRAEADGLIIALELDNYMKELQTQYRVPKEALQDCISKQHMLKIAQNFPEVEGKESEKTPKFDSLLNRGKAVDLSDRSPRENIAAGLKKGSKYIT